MFQGKSYNRAKNICIQYEVIYQANDANQLSNQMTLYTRIKTKRGSLEALWVLDFITDGIQQEYTSDDTNISALWGE